MKTETVIYKPFKGEIPPTHAEGMRLDSYGNMTVRYSPEYKGRPVKMRGLAPPNVSGLEPVAKTPHASLPVTTPFGALLHRVRGLRRAEARAVAEEPGLVGKFALAPRDLRRARLAKCVPGECPKAIAVPDCPRARCSAKGCGCDHLHAVRASAKCPLGRWAA